MLIRGKGTLDIFNGNDTADARSALPPELHEKAARLLGRLQAATSPDDLRTPNGNRLEKLVGRRDGQWSLRVNDTFRICFDWQQGEARNVEIVDYH